MAHLWISQEPEKWEILTLKTEAINMDPFPPQPLETSDEAVVEASSAVLLRLGEGDGVWALIGSQGSDVRINGTGLATGIRILADRDEITIGKNPSMYYSTEKPATVEEFPGTGAAAFCPRCRQQIAAHHPAVKCPRCGVFYHQSKELPCWTYAEVCALCPQPTALDAGYQWTPEVL